MKRVRTLVSSLWFITAVAAISVAMAIGMTGYVWHNEHPIAGTAVMSPWPVATVRSDDPFRPDQSTCQSDLTKVQAADFVDIFKCSNSLQEWVNETGGHVPLIIPDEGIDLTRSGCQPDLTQLSKDDLGKCVVSVSEWIAIFVTSLQVALH
jgi:hypothetical protein